MQKSQRRVLYEKHIASPAWKRKRLQRIKLDNGQCRLCGSPDNLEVHHKWTSGYKNIPNESVEDDLTTLCRDCHQAFHNRIISQSYQEYKIEIQDYQEPREVQKELTSYGMEDSRIRVNEQVSIGSTQWRISKPAKSNCETNEVNIQETGQDRSRFRGIG